jgi:signal transduction histidine kinase
MHFFRAPLIRRRVVDGVCAAGAILGTLVLFEIDIHAPRGVLDGIGYPAVVAISSRFGRKGITISTALASILILIGALLVPDTGISVAGEIANRVFGLMSVLIVALVLSQRHRLERHIETGELNLASHQRALLDTANSVLFADLPLRNRIKHLTEFAAQLLDVDRVGVFRRRWDTNCMECLDLYRNADGHHVIVADRADNLHPDYVETMRRDLIVVADDVTRAPQFAIRRSDFETNDIGAAMSAGIFLEGKMLGQITFSHRGAARHWTITEIVYARALANVAAILFSAERNRESLAALDLISEGIFATGATGSVLYANRAAREIAARGQSSSIGSDLPASAFPQPITPLHGISDKHEISYGNADLEIQRARLPAGGIITRINDVTLRNQVERESARLQKRLQQAAKMEAIGQFAGGIAHDFNNILGAISGFARFLEEDLPGDAKERGFAQRILSACERGKSLVEQMLDFARAKPIEFKPVDLGGIIQQCEVHLRATFPDGISLKVEVPSDFGWVAGNAVQLSQVVVNLCNNARDAVFPSGGNVEVALLPVGRSELETLVSTPGETWIGSFDPLKTYACIRVSDTGAGIEPANLARVFEPFFTTKGREQGTGLGLAVVHGAVTTHGGICHIRSVSGAGTSVSVYLPLTEEMSVRSGDSRNAGLSGQR